MSGRPPGATARDFEALRPAAAPMATVQDVLDELRAFHQTVRQLLEAVAVRTTPTLSRTDRETLERLLPAVVGALGSEPFASRDLPDDFTWAARRAPWAVGETDWPAPGARGGRADRWFTGGAVRQGNQRHAVACAGFGF